MRQFVAYGGVSKVAWKGVFANAGRDHSGDRLGRSVSSLFFFNFLFAVCCNFDQSATTVKVCRYFLAKFRRETFYFITGNSLLKVLVLVGDWFWFLTLIVFLTQKVETHLKWLVDPLPVDLRVIVSARHDQIPAAWKFVSIPSVASSSFDSVDLL